MTDKYTYKIDNDLNIYSFFNDGYNIFNFSSRYVPPASILCSHILDLLNEAYKEGKRDMLKSSDSAVDEAIDAAYKGGYKEGYEDGHDAGIAEERLDNPYGIVSLDELKEKLSEKEKLKEEMTDKYYYNHLIGINIDNEGRIYVQDVINLMNKAYEEGLKESPIVTFDHCGHIHIGGDELFNENKKLKEQIKLSQLENIALSRKSEDEIEDIKRGNEYLKNEFNFYFKKCTDMDDEMEKIKEEHDKQFEELGIHYDKKYNLIVEENKQLKEQIYSFKAIDRAGNIVCFVDKDYIELQEENKKLKNDIKGLEQNLQASLNREKNRLKELLDAEDELDNCKSSENACYVEELQEENKKLKENLDLKQNLINELDESNANLKSMIEELKYEIKIISNQLEKLSD